jgi:putative hydrolase of the HAD superfamily
LSVPISTVILDFGGVLGLPQDPLRLHTMASVCGLSVGQFRRLYERDRQELDRGTLSTEEYWSRILRAAGRRATAPLIARIEEEDSLGWTRINQGMVAWSAELRSAGYLTAILSNMPVDKLSYLRSSPAFDFINDFPVALFSCDYHLVKPEPQIYAACLKLLGRGPGECLFLDDSPANVAAGQAAGMSAILFRSAGEVVGELSLRWGLPVESLRDAARR